MAASLSTVSGNRLTRLISRAACAFGRAAIFSLRAYRKIVGGYHDDGSVIWDRAFETTRVTVEVNAHRMVVQVRGLMNRGPTDEEKLYLRMWAGEKGLVARA